MAKIHYLGEFELLVMLAVIRLGEGAYGVPISREIEEHTRRDVAFGTVYATLERLQEKGLVSSKLGEATPQRGGRARRYFRVTSAGLRTVRETKQSLTGFGEIFRRWKEECHEFIVRHSSLDL
jgi:DNA-binding PadR family transcriptional regulator